jgi:hypothetical protein
MMVIFTLSIAHPEKRAPVLGNRKKPGKHLISCTLKPWPNFTNFCCQSWLQFINFRQKNFISKNIYLSIHFSPTAANHHGPTNKSNWRRRRPTVIF